MHLSPEELIALLPSAPPARGAEIRKELRFLLRQRLLRKLPNPVGTCGHGHRVYADQRGAYSSGYVAHAAGHSLCNQGYGLNVAWDADTPQTQNIKKLLDKLRDER